MPQAFRQRAGELAHVTVEASAGNEIPHGSRGSDRKQQSDHSIVVQLCAKGGLVPREAHFICSLTH